MWTASSATAWRRAGWSICRDHLGPYRGRAVHHHRHHPRHRLCYRIAETIWVLGRDFDAQGQPMPGARIQSTIDLISRGLAWHPDIESTSEFFALSKELKRQFAAL